MDTITDGVKKLMLAGIGAVAGAADKSKEILDDLVEKGELTVEQGRALNQELKHTFNKTREEREEAKEKSVKDMDFAKLVSDLSKDELEALKSEIRKVEDADVD